MFTRWIEVSRSCIALRPVDACRSRFMNAEGATFDDAVRPLALELVERRGAVNVLRCTLVVAGKRCEAVVEARVDEAGRVIQELVDGAASGGRIVISFDAEGPGITRVDVHMRLPLRGVDALLSPFVSYALGRALDDAVSENVAGLESVR